MRYPAWWLWAATALLTVQAKKEDTVVGTTNDKEKMTFGDKTIERVCRAGLLRWAANHRFLDSSTTNTFIIRAVHRPRPPE